MASRKIVQFGIEVLPGPTGVKVVPHLLGIINESTPHKGRTDAYLSFQIFGKLEAAKASDASHVELEPAEFAFLQRGLERMLDGERANGHVWYFVIDALHAAQDKHG